ncbi:hypothetical protein [Halorubrum laminariae]|uniref:DUF1102 domain-containing protein n=1 Tax=Halorubrum laminariae TaxID=1433523 RepID=A0ABD6C274_9EURY|nr:hypothetical protein [Halorubrum laminariae]
MANRRSVLIGLGGLVAGGGAILSTGAFDTVEAQRTVSVETAGDADALLGLTPAERGDGSNEYVEETEGTISINLDGGADADGLNQNAQTTIRNLVTVTNQGTQTVDTLGLEFTETPSEIDPSETFSFSVDYTDDDGEDMVAHPDDGDGAVNILTGNNDIPSELPPGRPVNFGLQIDLIDGGNDDNALPEGGEYTLTITAEANPDN